MSIKHIIYMTLMLTIITSVSVAQQNNSEGQSDKSNQSDEEQVTQPDKTEQPKKPGIFVPSEEISEDLPVSYPVDI